MFNREPAVILGALSEAVRQIIPALIVFGFINWTGEKTAAFNIIVGVFVGFLNVVLTRSQVTATDKVDVLIHEAIRSPSGTHINEVKATVEAKENQ